LTRPKLQVDKLGTSSGSRSSYTGDAQTPTILVVDDDQLIRWSLTTRLTDEGYRVLEAENAADALRRCREGVDLVLLDYRLPDADGLTVLKQIKDVDSDTLVILLTAYSSVDTAVEAMKHGAYHYANKPFNVDEIALLVAKALETTQLRREVRALRATQARPYSAGTDFPAMSATALRLSDGVELPVGGIDLEQLERSLVVQALERTAWNQTKAAVLLGVNRDQIRYRIENFSSKSPRNGVRKIQIRLFCPGRRFRACAPGCGSQPKAVGRFFAGWGKFNGQRIDSLSDAIRPCRRAGKRPP
jgi:DNA-binding NtrC family response regulator